MKFEPIDKTLYFEKINAIYHNGRNIILPNEEYDVRNVGRFRINNYKNKSCGLKEIDSRFTKTESWFTCEKDHDFISTIYHNQFYDCIRCGWLSYEKEYKIQWDASKNRYSTPYDIQMANLICLEDFVKWKCFKCRHTWSPNSYKALLNPEPILNSTTGTYRTSRLGVREMYGICRDCNSETLIPWFNDCNAVYEEILYCWDRDKNICVDLENTIADKYQGIIDKCEHNIRAIEAYKKYDREFEEYFAANKHLIPRSLWDNAPNYPDIHKHAAWFKCPLGHEWEENWLTQKGYCQIEECEISTNEKTAEFHLDLGLDLIFKEFSKENGNILTPAEFSMFGSNEKNLNFRNYSLNLTKKFIWQCSKNPIHVWKETLWQRLRNRECRECYPSGESFIELDFFDEIKKVIPDLSRKNWVENLYWSSGNGKQKIVADMVSLSNRIAIEYDGYAYHSGIRTKSNYKIHEDRDARKTQAFIDAGWKVIRIREGQLRFLKSIDGLYQVKHNYIGTRFSHSYNESISNTINKIINIEDLFN